ncbi:MAG: hypothetical protein LC118_07055 [Dehalococcoidia bacterium]|nr:hypothetical protein [Dehalococcoidia bacterium]
MALTRSLARCMALLLGGFAAVFSSNIALSAPDAPDTNVTIEVKRVEPVPAGAVPYFLCIASIERGGVVLAQPKIQTPQGTHASIATTTDGDVNVVLKVFVSAPNRLSYEVAITPVTGPLERHRATITLPA